MGKDISFLLEKLYIARSVNFTIYDIPRILILLSNSKRLDHEL